MIACYEVYKSFGIVRITLPLDICQQLNIIMSKFHNTAYSNKSQVCLTNRTKDLQYKTIKLSRFIEQTKHKKQNKAVKAIQSSNKTESIRWKLSRVTLQSDKNYKQRKTIFNNHEKQHKLKLRTVNTKQIQSDYQQSTQWFEPVKSFITNLFPSSDGCTCEEPCKWAIKLKDWSGYRTHCAYYHTLKDRSLEPVIVSQIEKDIHRTQPTVQTFKTQKYQTLLRNILVSYAKYDEQIQYVQGMNIIVSCILYHVKEEQATFWIFCKLMEQHRVRDNFLNNFEHCFQQIHSIKIKVKQYLCLLHQFLKDHNIRLQVVCFSWVISLFMTLVPVEQSHLVFAGLISKGWPFIQNLALSYLAYLQKEIFSSNDESEILTILSVSYCHRNNVDWKQIIEHCNNISQ